MTEEWRDVLGFDGYQVSSFGRVRGPRRILNPVLTQYGYHQVTLCNNGKKYTRFVHRLVAVAFLGPPPSEEHDVAHGNGDKTFNAYPNLRWATPKENHADKERHGTSHRGTRHPLAKLSDGSVRAVRKLFARGVQQKELAQFYGVSRRAINNIVNRRTWTHI